MKNPSYQTWQALANLGYKDFMEEYERRNHPNQKGDSGASHNAKVYPTPVKIVNAIDASTLNWKETDPIEQRMTYEVIDEDS